MGNWRRSTWGVLPVLLSLVACGDGAGASPTSQPSDAQGAMPGPGATGAPTTAHPTASLPSRGVATFEDFRDAYCSSWTSIFKAVGNPDTGGRSDLSRALDAAVQAGDAAAANVAAAAIEAELASGRREAQAGAGWPPAAAFMGQLDRFLAAFEAGTEAERASAGPAGVDGRPIWQAAFQAAGGLDAWQAMRAAAGPIASARPPDSGYQCPGIPVSV